MELGRVKAVVSGGASGLGLATAKRILAAGGRAVLLDVQDEAGRAAAKALGDGARYERCDVTREADTEAAVARAAEFLGGLNLSVACAGVATAGKLLGRDGPLPSADFARVLAINTAGTFHLDRAAAARMQKNEPDANGERGLLVHTASIAAAEGQIGQVAYAASKAAVVGMVLPLARELARHGIRVIAIAPGIFSTPMIEKMPAEVQQSLGQQVPFPPRLGRPEEFAELVAAVVTNTMLNGCTLRLDGAMRMGAK